MSSSCCGARYETWNKVTWASFRSPLARMKAKGTEGCAFGLLGPQGTERSFASARPAAFLFVTSRLLTAGVMGYFDNAFFPLIENGELDVAAFLGACGYLPKFFGK